MTDKLTVKLTDQEREIAGLKWALKTKQNIIDRLKEGIRRLADQDATLSIQGGNVTVTMDATLTAEEREAIEWAVETSDYYARAGHRQAKDAAATIRKLLERLSDQNPTPSQ